jgi:hypothetical protein
MRTTLLAAAAILAVATAAPAFAQDAGNGSQSRTQFPTTAQQQHGRSNTPTVTEPSGNGGTTAPMMDQTGQTGTGAPGSQTTGQMQHDGNGTSQ